MNQVLKRCVYQLGTDEQHRYIAEKGGLNEVEWRILCGWRNGRTDLSIQSELHMDESAYKMAETATRLKVAIGVLYCITSAMANDQ